MKTSIKPVQLIKVSAGASSTKMIAPIRPSFASITSQRGQGKVKKLRAGKFR